MIDLLIAPLLAGLALAAVAGPVGCFLVWRRMAYFGDTLAHGALLGIALGAVLHIAPMFGVLIVCLLIALGLHVLSRRRDLGSDTLLGVLAHAALAFGVIAVAVIEGLRAELLALLFGDLLAVDAQDAAFIAGGALLTLAMLALGWRALLAVTVDEDLARVEGVPVGAVKFLLAVMLAVIVALAMQVVGLMLVTALLLIPAAAARPFAREPAAMARIAALVGMASVLGGLAMSWWLDLPAGPSVVAMSVLLFLASRRPPRRS
jgi:zinc transport system permease protein